MLLTIDIGNTNTSVGVYRGDELIANWRTETKKSSTSDELAILFRDFFELSNLNFKNIKGTAISNVVPSLNHAIESMSKKYFNLEPLFVNFTNAGIKINYPNPAEIGADRLANAVAAYEKSKSATIVVDFGTATTFDYIDQTGAYCGGSIAPGIAISNEALYRWTSKLPRVDIAKTKDTVGKTTTEAIQSGVFHGYTGLVMHLIGKMKKEVETNPKVLATGGLASLFVGELGIEVEKFLTLDGLKLIWARNTDTL